jgi:hypothetical protein
VNGPAGTEARDGEDEGTFRWPTTRLPSCSASSRLMRRSRGHGHRQRTSRRVAADWQHALEQPASRGRRSGPPAGPFSPVTYGHLLRSRPAPDAGEESGGEQPPWPPAPPPGKTRCPRPAGVGAGQVPLPVREPAQAARRAAATGAAQPAGAAEPRRQPAAAAQPAGRPAGGAAAQPTWPPRPRDSRTSGGAESYDGPRAVAGAEPDGRPCAGGGAEPGGRSGAGGDADQMLARRRRRHRTRWPTLRRRRHRIRWRPRAAEARTRWRPRAGRGA